MTPPSMSKLYDGIDYDFRPNTFWISAPELLKAILRKVKGRKRRKMIRDYYVTAKLDELYDELLSNIPDEDARKLLPKLHSTFTGKREEVEIATVALIGSQNEEVTTLWAKRAGGRIKYRIPDSEYDEVYDVPQQTSVRPFSLRELIVFLDSVKLRGADPKWHRFGFPLLYNEYNLEADPNDLELLESLRDFTRVSSDFYPDLERHYCRVIDDWYSLRKREIESSTRLGS